MPTLTLNFTARIEGLRIDSDQISPAAKTFTLTSGEMTRTTWLLESAVPRVLDPGDIEPTRWFFMNVHAENDLVIDFGGSAQFTLGPGEWNWISTDQVPSASGSGGASALFWAAIAD